MMVQDALAFLHDGSRTLQDTVTAHGIGFQDSVVVESPLPGGVAEVVRFIFRVPQWIQIAGLVLAIVLGIWLAVTLWNRRDAIAEWFRTRSQAMKLGLVTVALVLVAGGVAFGSVSWNYMQHDNGFCTGCHVMESAFSAFTASGHAELECHDCHQQSIWASSRQLVMWVAERPENIDSHAEIPDILCETCHSSGESEEWSQIAATAGHRVHYEVEDDDLDGVTCLSCHAPEVHEFKPIDETCAQAGCHEDMSIELGAMAEQTSLHCATCHEFTVEVAALATTDSAASSLVPGFDRCTSCHEMAEMLTDFDPEREPHEARCGTCHDAHEQTTAADAAETCAECHDDWRNEPFHVGDAHEDAGSQCTLCHLPHDSKVDPSGCASCHTRIVNDPEAPAEIRQRLQRALPFDTAAALRETRGTTAPLPPGHPDVARMEASTGDHLPDAIALLASAGDPAGDLALALSRSASFAAPADSFEHSAHEDLTCITCHTTAEGHGGLTFAQPRGCQICHHRGPTRSDCAECHEQAADLPVSTANMTIHPVPDAEPIHRSAEFAHESHGDLACTECHTTPVTLEATAEVATCASCHESHHEAAVSCHGCHAIDPDIDTAHAPPEAAHEACAECHTGTTIAGLSPDRDFCLTCHQAEADHEPDEACTVCHMLETPAEFRTRLGASDRIGR